MARLVLEGTWEEIAAHADELIGKRLKVVVEEEAPTPQPNYAALDAMRQADEVQKNMNPKPGSNGIAILREGRRGHMYGDNPAD